MLPPPTISTNNHYERVSIMNNEIKPSELKECIYYAAKTERPIMIWGKAGIGKSRIVYQAAAEMFPKKVAKKGRRVYEFRATLLDPVDLRGLMEIINAAGRRVTSWCPPVFLPDKPGGVMFIDELPTATPLVQAAMYQLMLDKKLGEYELPEDTVIICAGNMEGHRAAVNRMPTPLANRFIHQYLGVDVNEWIDWAITNDLAIEVIAFIRLRPTLLDTFDPDNLTEKAFCSPRTLEFASDIIKAKPPRNILLHLLRGTLGKGPAEELFSILDDWKDLPDLNNLIKHPDKAEIPSKPSVMFAVIQGLAKIVDAKLIGNFLTYANRLEANGKMEFAVAMVTDALTRDPSLRNTKAYKDGWLLKHPELYVRTH